jgi:hypothetical protein
MERIRGTKTGPTNPTNGAPGPAARLDIFGPPPLIEGEDAAAYDELLIRISAAVKRDRRSRLERLPPAALQDQSH